ncbi:MAG: carbohydrate kinase family protein [Firmicutes bacterium]|nr:carbohydrate kinase family protein [Bacillota bacterium]
MNAASEGARLKDFRVPRRYERQPVIVFGDALVDHVCEIELMPPVGGDAVIRSSGKHPGGAGLNTSTGLALLGVSCHLVTTVGDDEDGRYLRRHLESVGVGVSHVRSGGTTGYVVSFVDSGGERTMFSYRGAASIPLEMTPDLEEALEHAPLILVSGYGLQDAEQAELYLDAAERVRKAGGIVAFDPTPVVGQLARGIVERMLAVADVVLANASELRTLSGCENMECGIESILQRTPCLGLKLGQRGSIVALGPAAGASRISSVSGLRRTDLQPARLECPARRVEAVDTTGAGDAFNAGFLASLLYGMPPRAWGEWGNSMAARVIVRKGASLGAVDP